MTQLEILKMARLGICGRMSKEEFHIYELETEGKRSDIAQARLKKLTAMFDEVNNLIAEEEDRAEQ